MSAVNSQVRHGYTLRDIDAFTRTAFAISRWHTAADADERYAVMRLAIVEHILTAPETPTRSDLLRSATAAADAHVRAELHHHGWDTRNYAAGSGAMHRFQTYWSPPCRDPFADRVVDRVALTQIWPQIAPRHRDVLRILAATGDHGAAAEALGLTQSGYASRLRKARASARALWHEGETPRRMPPDRRLFSRAGTDNFGRKCLTVSQVAELSARRHAGESVTALAVEVGYTRGALSMLLTGKNRAAPDLSAQTEPDVAPVNGTGR